MQLLEQGMALQTRRDGGCRVRLRVRGTEPDGDGWR
jgi:hypothetical protein